jgi:phosphatidylglycerol---prolipoprotein diacylglyceryl transferase
MGESRMPSTFSKNNYYLWIIGLFFFTWVGAKMLFVVTQNNYESTDLMSSTNFWLGGGFVYLGGLIGGGIYSFLFIKLKNLSFESLNFSIVPMLWGHSIGRIGCFLAGCCFGTETTVPWSIHLHQAQRHPVQLYESLLLATLAWMMNRYSKEHLIHYLAGYGTIRFILEFYRADDIRGIFLGISTSQIISLSMIITSIVLMARAQLLENKR